MSSLLHILLCWTPCALLAAALRSAQALLSMHLPVRSLSSDSASTYFKCMLPFRYCALAHTVEIWKRGRMGAWRGKKRRVEKAGGSSGGSPRRGPGGPPPPPRAPGTAPRKRVPQTPASQTPCPTTPGLGPRPLRRRAERKASERVAARRARR